MFRTLRACTRSRGFRSITLLAPLCFLTACPPAAVNYNYASLPNPVTSLYKVHAGDVVHIRVMRNQNTTGRYTVRPDGYIGYRGQPPDEVGLLDYLSSIFAAPATKD